MGRVGISDLLGREAPELRTLEFKHAQAWASQGWAIPLGDECQGEKKSKVKGLGSPRMGGILGGRKRVIVLADYQLRVTFLCNFQKKKKYKHLDKYNSKVGYLLHHRYFKIK